MVVGGKSPSRSFHSVWAESIIAAKTGEPQNKPPGHPQAELGLSHMWPELCYAWTHIGEMTSDLECLRWLAALTTRARGLLNFVLPIL